MTKKLSELNKVSLQNIELVILLQGNVLIVPVLNTTKDKEELERIIIEVMQKSTNEPFSYIKWGDATIFGKYIVGWYFRPIPENPSEKVMKFLEKKLPDANEGDGWKNEGD